MKPWSERPFEIRNLFNPAFCGVLLLRALQGFEEEDNEGMPFSLTPLVLPLCLHKDSRQLITKHSRSYFIKTVAKYPQILVGFADRARTLLPYTFEGLGIAMQHQALTVSDEGRVLIVPKGVRKKIDRHERNH
jgi:hypothetical protein